MIVALRQSKTSARRRAEAQDRARELLACLLSPGALEQLLLCGFLEIISGLTPGRVYRIPHHSGQVEVYEEGQLKCVLCVGPKTWLPRPDVILAHKP